MSPSPEDPARRTLLKTAAAPMGAQTPSRQLAFHTQSWSPSHILVESQSTIVAAIEPKTTSGRIGSSL